MLVENNKNLDLRQALALAASVQPLKVDDKMIDAVRTFDKFHCLTEVGKFQVYLLVIIVISKPINIKVRNL